MAISSPVTPGQVSFLLGFIPLFVAWMYSEWLEYRKSSASTNPKGLLWFIGGFHVSATSHLLRFFLMDKAFLLENRLTLRAISEFGAHLAYFYICDRADLFGKSKKNYSRDRFLFLYFLLILVAAMTSFKIHQDKSTFSGKSILYLNRHQTEEWKGWMQVLFLMYHYFNAKEIYNAIRVFIAAYVWMTGFGNFSYYYVRKDFSLARFAQMMWRLNFFCGILLHCP